MQRAFVSIVRLLTEVTPGGRAKLKGEAHFGRRKRSYNTIYKETEITKSNASNFTEQASSIAPTRGRRAAGGGQSSDIVAEYMKLSVLLEAVIRRVESDT